MLKMLPEAEFVAQLAKAAQPGKQNPCSLNVQTCSKMRLTKSPDRHAVKLQLLFTHVLHGQIEY